MRIKRIKKLKVNSYNFDIIWDPKDYGGSLRYSNSRIQIGVASKDTARIFDTICHELWEVVAIEMNVRLSRPDCNSDFIFVYDHRQHETMSNMFASLLSQFIV